MYPRILARMRECVRQNRIITTIHALEEMDADDLLKEDLEHCILHGEIVARQWDDDFQEYKYLVGGTALDSEEIEVVAKVRGDTAIVITAYLL
jgi:hypothetical protein